MTGRIVAIYRHTIKGFTPEPLTAVDLAPGQPFPYDRLYAVENGPSGFDPAAPAFTPKQKFTVLANLPKVASVCTRYVEASGVLQASAPGVADFQARLTGPAGRAAFADWLTVVLGEELRGPLRMFEAPAAFRFTDHPQGQVSVLNLASVRDLEARIGNRLDPLRFRANLHVEGWPAWAENDWAGCAFSLGAGQATVFKPIVRCAATQVNLETAERDLDVPRALFDGYGHMFCGIYVHMTKPGRVAVGDPVSIPHPTQLVETAP